MSVIITIIKDGPAIINSTSEIIEIKGTDIVSNDNTKPIALCRCGKSANKIYCDGSHSKKKQNEEFFEDLKKSEIM